MTVWTQGRTNAGHQLKVNMSVAVSISEGFFKIEFSFLVLFFLGDLSKISAEKATLVSMVANCVPIQSTFAHLFVHHDIGFLHFIIIFNPDQGIQYIVHLNLIYRSMDAIKLLNKLKTCMLRRLRKQRTAYTIGENGSVGASTRTVHRCIRNGGKGGYNSQHGNKGWRKWSHVKILHTPIHQWIKVSNGYFDPKRIVCFININYWKANLPSISENLVTVCFKHAMLCTFYAESFAHSNVIFHNAI